MLRTLLAFAGVLVLAPAAAYADPFGELPFHAVEGPARCLRATGAPGELVRQGEDTAQFLTAGPAGLTPAGTLPVDGALQCADVAVWPGGGGLLAFPVASMIDNEVWVRGFLREPGLGWGEAIELLPPRTNVTAGEVASAVSARGDALVAMSAVDSNRVADIRLARRLPGGAFGAPERIVLGKIGLVNAPDVRAAYAASGEAVIVWSTQGPSKDDSRELSAAIAPPGGALSAPQTLGRIDVGTSYALTVGADGRALVVFTAGGQLVGVERSPDAGFGAPFTLAPTVGALGARPAAVLRPDGGAVVAWASPGDASLTARTRERPGTFGPALALAREKRLEPAALMVGQRFFAALITADMGNPRVALATDGRAVVTWSQLSRRQGVWQIVPGVALLDFAGGARESRTLGGALRTAEEVTPVLLADGSRAVAWTDNDGPQGRVHLAREGSPDAVDPPAPKVTVTLVGAPKLKAEESLRLRVTCDAACDVIAQLAGQEDVTASASLAAAGARRLELRPVSRPIATGTVRVLLRSGAPGAHRATAGTLTLHLRREGIVFPPRARDVTVTRTGDDLTVRWRTDRPARASQYDVWAVDDDYEPLSRAAGKGTAKRTRFALRVPDARDATRVIVYALADGTDETRQTTVRVPR